MTSLLVTAHAVSRDYNLRWLSVHACSRFVNYYEACKSSSMRTAGWGEIVKLNENDFFLFFYFIQFVNEHMKAIHAQSASLRSLVAAESTLQQQSASKGPPTFFLGGGDELDL